MALGARPVNILGMVLKKGLTLVTAGIVVGIFASLGLTHYLSSQVWGVSTIDPWTFGTVTTVTDRRHCGHEERNHKPSSLGVGLMASFLPARNAAKVDPLISLRHE